MQHHDCQHLPRINAWHKVFTGAFQHEGRATGGFQLWLRLMQELGSKTCRVDLHRWKEDADRLAEQVFLVRQAQGGPPPAIYVYGYSRGGWASRQFARGLRKRGIAINHMVLCDPVLWGLSLVPWAKLRLPPNVREVTWFYQRMNWPMGHRVVAENKNQTVVHAGVEICATHQYADDSQAFHEACLAAAGVE